MRLLRRHRLRLEQGRHLGDRRRQRLAAARPASATSPPSSSPPPPATTRGPRTPTPASGDPARRPLARGRTRRRGRDRRRRTAPPAASPRACCRPTGSPATRTSTPASPARRWPRRTCPACWRCCCAQGRDAAGRRRPAARHRPRPRRPGPGRRVRRGHHRRRQGGRPGPGHHHDGGRGVHVVERRGADRRRADHAAPRHRPAVDATPTAPADTLPGTEQAAPLDPPTTTSRPAPLVATGRAAGARHRRHRRGRRLAPAPARRAVAAADRLARAWPAPRCSARPRAGCRGCRWRTCRPPCRRPR